MATLKIRQFGDPVLRQRAKEIDKVTGAHRRLARDMLDTMRAANGVGLAGPQVGVLERIFVWEVGDRNGVVINPVIVERSQQTVVEEEGCLSIPGLAYEVERPARVVLQGLDETGAPVRIETDDDFVARVFQHETDHLDGVLFIDRLPGERRKEALSALRQAILGLPPSAQPVVHEETR